MDTKLIFVIGAGATFSDVTTSPTSDPPPLDKLFFTGSFSKYKDLVTDIGDYIMTNYHRNILDSRFDSLEQTMSTIYIDLFDSVLRESAAQAFIKLVKLFNLRLSASTNPVTINYQRQLYRILIRYFNIGYNPETITFITFNQDIQIEKILNFINVQKKWKHLELFRFPHCYGFSNNNIKVTAPSSSTSKGCFEINANQLAKTLVLKLHGSLNWYTPSESEEMDPDVLFNPSRELQITRRKIIDPNMKYTDHKKKFTLPVIIPPINNKSAIMNVHLKNIWQKAEERLLKANEIIFWGYSLPESDFESRNLFQRNIVSNHNIKRVVVVDPDPNVCKKYIDLLSLKTLMYYNNASSFIEDYFLT